MSEKQDARNWLDARWESALRDALPRALNTAQTRKCAESVMGRLLPRLPKELLRALAAEERDELVIYSGVPEDLDSHLVEALSQLLADEVTASLPDNPYARLPRFRGVIRERVTHWRTHPSGLLDRLIDEIFEQYGERLAQPEDVRTETLRLLNNEALDLCRAGASPDAAHLLKAVTLLAVPWGDRAHRASLVSRIQNHKTASAPFVIKYLNRDTLPQIRDIPAADPQSILACTSDLSRLCPQITQVVAAVDMFRTKKSILSNYIDPEHELAPEHQAAYSALQDYSVVSPGGILVTARTALHSHRQVEYRVVDGAVCLIGLAGVLERILQQTRRCLGLPGGENSRPHEILKIIQRDHPKLLSPETRFDLDLAFPVQDLGLRDSIAHGAFFFSDALIVERAVGVLTRCLMNFIADVRRAPEAPNILSPSPGPSMLSAASRAVILQQAQQAPLVVKLEDLDTILNASDVIRWLGPDKAKIWRTSLMIWGDKEVSRDPLFVHYGLTLSLLTLEEALRAIFEESGQMTLRTTPTGPNRVKCELIILDEQPGNLLDPKLLTQVLGPAATQPPFSDSTMALTDARNSVMHGQWADIAGIERSIFELALKWILTVANTRLVSSS